MPNYQYTAVDASGKLVRGSVAGGSLQEVSRGLRAKGLRVSHVVEDLAGGTATAPIVRTGQAGQVNRVSPPTPQATSVTAQPSVVKTKNGRNKGTFLLFSQLANYLKSGISPQQAFTDLQHRVLRKDYAESLEACRAAVSAGGSMAEAMQRYPDLYPPHAVGLIRAGEAGGFVPQAAERVAQLANSGMRWARPFWVVTWMVTAMLLAMPLAFVVIQGALDSWSAQEKAGGSASGVTLLAEQVGKLLLWPLGPIILGGLGLLYVAFRWWQSRKLRLVRHKLAHTYPIFGKRSRAEGAATFAWTLSSLSKAGLRPQTAWGLAVESVPNLLYKQRLLDAGKLMHERTPISEALAKTQVLPEEAAMMVHTGEVTGNVPSALIDVADMSQTEFEATEVQSKRLVTSWTFLLFGLGFVFYLWLIYSYFYPEFMRRFTSDL